MTAITNKMLGELEHAIRHKCSINSCKINYDESLIDLTIDIFRFEKKGDKAVASEIGELSRVILNMEPSKMTFHHLDLESDPADHEIDLESHPRPMIKTLRFDTTNGTSEAQVVLTLDQKKGVGTAATVSLTQTQMVRKFAEATLIAVENILDTEGIFSVERVSIDSTGELKVAVVVVELITPSWRKTISGSCPLMDDSDIMAAVVKATLQSINRLFPKLVAGFSPETGRQFS